MGFFDSIFGNKKQNKQIAKKKDEIQALSCNEISSENTAISPEILAVIAAAIEAHNMNNETIAIIAAAAYMTVGQCEIKALRIIRKNDMWKNAGRQKLMDARNFA